VATVSLHATWTRVNTALERGHGAEATSLLTPVLRGGSLNREDELHVRAALAEAWLLQDDLSQASAALGRRPDTMRDPVSDATLSALWRLHGRLAFARGEQSRAIALHTRALRHAELAHDSRAIGLVRYELSLCYKQVGDTGIVREHLTEAASALHAAGDRRHLALVHSLSAVLLAQAGRCAEANAGLRQGERLATAIPADDVLAGIVHNQANVAMITHQHDQALAFAERSVELFASLNTAHGQAIALATLGQILVQRGDLVRAEAVLNQALEVRSPVKFQETTGAVFDTLAQINLMRGSYERAEEYLRLARDAYGALGTQTMRWYEWSLRVIGVRLAIRRQAYGEAVTLADDLAGEAGVPPTDAIQAELAACEALVAAGHHRDAGRRLEGCEARLDPRAAPANWGEFLRIRGLVRGKEGRAQAARHDLAQSATVLELFGERYLSALSQLALARLEARGGSRPAAERHLGLAGAAFERLGALHDLDQVETIRAQLAELPEAPAVTPGADADEAIARRLVEAALFPELLLRETATALLESTEARAVVVFSGTDADHLHVLASAGCEPTAAADLARAAHADRPDYLGAPLVVEALGRDPDGPRRCAMALRAPLSEAGAARLRMFAAIARQGFDLCEARDRPHRPVDQVGERPIEPLLPGFVCAGAAMHRLVEQIQRLQGHNLTVLITGESGTGKDLVARAIHGGSPRSDAMFLPYNCTTTSRELADSQLFGHRRGSFTGAVSDQQGLIRSAAGGTLFLDEVGDLPLDVQPKLLRFLEQGEVMPVGETRPQAVDVRVLAATNADLEQRVSEGTFREDLYYRLSVIHIQVPPLRERREEVPHLSTFFLREACERLGKPDVHLSQATLDLFSRYWWPGNVRQLKNEIQRAVAMSVPEGLVEPDQLSADLTAPPAASGGAGGTSSARAIQPGNLSQAVEEVERELITMTLTRAGGNVSEAARVLGLTRRGLYLKLRRLGLEGVVADSK
jgi:DNA-binding NtrC family response regulator/tetratricopeptide (TPR) repeat protein